MLCIANKTSNPYFNIASEEYLLKNITDDVFMLYQNSPSVIVGKHQNTFAEINYWYTKDNKIDVVRRLSGGGTVFHDFGNLNFTFIRNGNDGNLVDFKRFTDPIIRVLQSLGVPAERSGRNDLIINDLKFSGNAEHVYKNRILHHGTLLFSSKLESLGEALRVNSAHYHDKAVKSFRSKVTNITDHLPVGMSIEKFTDNIINHIFTEFSDVIAYNFSETDIENIEKLVAEKYSTWEWNFGYSPKFTLNKSGYLNGKTITIILEIEKGIIVKASVIINNEPLMQLEEALINQRYNEEIIREIINQTFEVVDCEPILRIFFKYQ